MAQRSDKTAWTLALAAAALGAGAFGRYPLGFAADGLAFGAAFALMVVVLALPMLLGEAAFGQFRRRNAVDVFGPSGWRFAGWAAVAASLFLAAYLAVVAGWAMRYAYESFEGLYFDDPERYFRLAEQGADTLLFTLGAFIAAGLVLAGGWGRMRTALTITAGLALVAALALAVWGLWMGGSAGRSAAFAFELDVVDGAFIARAAQQAILPGLVGIGAVATLSGRIHDRDLPREAAVLVILWVLVPVLVGAGLAALADSEGVALDGGVAALFGSIAALFGSIGGTVGGMLSGLFYGVLLAGSLSALVVVLEVPASVLRERSPPTPEAPTSGWTPAKAAIAVALAAYLIALPLTFLGGSVAAVGLALAAIVAPLAGIAMSVHIGWIRPEVLDGFTVGDAKHRLDATLRPALRFVVPILLLAIAVLGTMGALADWGALDRGADGLWKLVP